MLAHKGLSILQLLSKVARHLPAQEKVNSICSVFGTKSTRRGLYLILDLALYPIPIDNDNHWLLSRDPRKELSLLNTIQRGPLIQSNLNDMCFRFTIHANMV